MAQPEPEPQLLLPLLQILRVLWTAGAGAGLNGAARARASAAGAGAGAGLNGAARARASAAVTPLADLEGAVDSRCRCRFEWCFKIEKRPKRRKMQKRPRYRCRFEWRNQSQSLSCCYPSCRS